MLKILYNFEEFKRFLPVLARVPQRTARLLDRAARRITTGLRDAIRIQAAPHGSYPGTIEESFQGPGSSFQDGTASFRGTVFTTFKPDYVPYIIEEGSQEHFVEAGRGSVISFYWERKAKKVFVRWVIHPGTKAYKVFQRGTERFESERRRILRGVFDALGKEWMS